MFSGLYSDLPVAKDEEQGQSKEAQSSAYASKLSALAPSSALRGRGSAAPSTRGRGRGPGPVSRPAPSSAVPPASVPPPAPAPPAQLDLGVAEEYDPSRPSDYEHLRQRAEQRRLAAEAEAARQEEARLRRSLEAREREAQAREKEEALAELRELERIELARAEVDVGGHVGSWVNEGLTETSQAKLGDAAVVGQPPLPPEPRFKGMGLAQRMLEKMGWREGQGLGSRGQGIAAPLAMQKTDARAGIIVTQEAAPLAPLPPGATRVILLCNMVGPGQVDESLEEEVGEECSRFGVVTSVLIFEVTQKGYPVDRAVRIFVQFDSPHSAAKAYAALNGRFFGGRTVHAEFFSEERFARSELAPPA